MKIENGLIVGNDIKGIPFKVDLIPKSNGTSRPGYEMKPEYITIHNTGNSKKGADAAAHTSYVDTTTAYVSWHFTVDDKEIYQELPIIENGWHATDGGKGPGNRTSIGIEICENGDIDWPKAKENAIKLIVGLLKDLELSVNRVVPHQKWSGKYCPRKILDEGWDKFIEEVTKVYNAVDKPVNNGYNPIVGPNSATLTQMEQWAADRNATGLFISLAPLFFEIGEAKGCDGVAAYAQSAKETAFGKFGGVIDASYCNPCGLKVTEGGGNYDPNAHKRFKDWSEGITAMIDHLLLYAGAPGYPLKDTPDPRHFTWIKGKAPTIEELGGKWAPNPEYGNSIVKNYLDPLRATEIIVVDDPTVEDLKGEIGVLEYELKLLKEANRALKATCEGYAKQLDQAEQAAVELVKILDN